MKHSLYPSLSVFALLLGTLTMVGCGGAASFSNPKATDPPPPSAPQVVAGPAVKGSVYGGHAPLGGAHVYLLQPGTTGYGSAATSLLGSGTTTSPGGYTLTANVNDPNVPVGAMYETSDYGGGFNFTGAYNCTVGQPVYVYAWGGNIGGGALNNESIVQLATLGNCPSSGNFSTAGNGAISYIYLNEVSTVATAYTFQPYTLVGNNNAWDIGTSNTTQGLLGIANAANTAAQLYNIEGGTQISTTQDGEGHLANYQTLLNGVPNDGNGVVPQATIDTLANILSDCVDSTVITVGTPTATCTSLFTDARDNGETTGTEPTDTATAMINIARFPAGNNSDTTAADNVQGSLGIYVLQPGTLPYVPALTKAPNDWTIAINYPGLTAVTGSASSGPVTNNTLNLAESIAVDDIGQIWITSQGEENAGGTAYTYKPDIVRWSNLGAQNSINSYTYIPGYVSIDGSNNAWTGNANDAPSAAPYSGNGGTGTSIFFAGSNGVFSTDYGTGYYKAYTVIANQAGDAFFFAGNSSLAGNYDMWEYEPGGTLSGGSPIDINATTAPGTVTQDLTITAASETNAGGTYTYSFNFTYAGGTPTTPLAVGDTVPLTLANDPGVSPGKTAATGWPALTSVTVASVNGTSFTATGTTPTTNSNDGNGAATTAAIDITAATETHTGGGTYTYTFDFTNVGTPGAVLAVGDVVPLTLSDDPGTGTHPVAATGWQNLTQVTVATVNSATNPTSFTATGTTSITKNAATTNTVSANTNGPTETLTISSATETNAGSTYTYTFNYTLPAGSLALAAGDTVYFPAGTLTNDPGTGTPKVAATGWNNLTSVTVASVNDAGTQFTATGTIPTTNTNDTGGATSVALAITGVTVSSSGGVYPTYTYTFAAVNTGTTPLVAGDTIVLTALKGHGTGNNWAALDATYTVVSATAAQFVVTSTTDGGTTGNFTSGTGTYKINGATGTGTLQINGATGSGTYTYTNANGATGTGSYMYTGTITTPGAIPAGQNVAHGAIDSAGHLWITTEADPSGGTACNDGCEIARISPTGVPDFTSIVTAEQPEFPAIDASNNAWIAVQETTSDIYVVSPTGGTTILTAGGGGGSTATGALMTSTFGAAVDGNGNVWFANRCGNYGACGTTSGENSIFVLNGGVSTPGTLYNAISPSTNYVPETEYAGATSFTKMLDGSLNLAIDSSGNVWITNYTGGGVVELVGAAAPVVTPLSVAAGNGELGQKP